MNRVVRIKPAGERIAEMDLLESIDHFAAIRLGTKQILSEEEYLRKVFKNLFKRDGIYRGHKYEIEAKRFHRRQLDAELVAAYMRLNGANIDEFYKPVEVCELTPRAITVEAKIVKAKRKRKAKAKKRKRK